MWPLIYVCNSYKFVPILFHLKSLNRIIKLWWLWRLCGGAMEAYELSKLIKWIDSILLQDVSTIKTISYRNVAPNICLQFVQICSTFTGNSVPLSETIFMDCTGVIWQRTQKTINTIEKWCDTKGLNISALKTKIVMFTCNRNWTMRPISVGGNTITVQNCKCPWCNSR